MGGVALTIMGMIHGNSGILFSTRATVVRNRTGIRENCGQTHPRGWRTQSDLASIQRSTDMQKTHAVVLGSRFGGMAVITWLRRLCAPESLSITVIDQWQEMVFRPGLVHSMDQSPDGLVSSLTMALPAFWKRLHLDFIHDIIISVDPNRRLVYTAAHDPVAYDVLFIATGSTPLWTSIAGLEFCHQGICEGYLAHRTAWLNQTRPEGSFVFAMGPIWGNPSWAPRIQVGCECPLLESALLWDQSLRKRKLRDGAEITVITPAAHLAEDGGPMIRERVDEMMARRQINVVTGARYVEVGTGHIQLFDRRIAYDRVVWIPPAGGSRWLQGSDLDDGYGWVPTDPFMHHPDWPEIYAVGDVVSHPWPKMGHSAMVQARVAVHHFSAMRQGKTRGTASYHPYLVWALETGPGQAFFALSNVFYGGNRQIVYHGRSPFWAKQAFQWAYVARSGALPIMP